MTVIARPALGCWGAGDKGLPGLLNTPHAGAREAGLCSGPATTQAQLTHTRGLEQAHSLTLDLSFPPCNMAGLS